MTFVETEVRLTRGRRLIFDVERQRVTLIFPLFVEQLTFDEFERILRTKIEARR